jgi:molybdenum cofactor cytidylyltransferase
MNLREAFDLGEHEVVSIVGGGGKTTILYRLAQETVAAGDKAAVTGTTRFTPPASGDLPPAVLDESPIERLAGARTTLERSSLVVVGAGWGNQGRIMPVEPDELAALAAVEGVAVVVAEADGSAGRPFKAPAAHEPVVAAATSLLISVVGVDILGEPLTADRVHRPEIVAQLSGSPMGAPVSELTVAAVILSEQGGRKGLPAGARWLPVINKVDTPERLAAARRLAQRLLEGGASRVVIAAASHEPPVVEVAT